MTTADDGEKKKIESAFSQDGATGNVVLVGSVASGKSTVGFQLAHFMGLGILDLDAMIEKSTGKTIQSIFAEAGEAGFRDLESEHIAELANIMNHVVITGAGAVERPQNWENLRKFGPIVWLATPISEIVTRISIKPQELRSRPLLAAAADIECRDERELFLKTKIDKLFQRRQEIYEQADITFVGSYATPEVCALMIKQKLNQLSF